mgnify:CR=1 FL=1
MCQLWRGCGEYDSIYRIFFLRELEARISALANEAYYLVKHAGFTYADVLIMPAFERDEFMTLLIDENQREKDSYASLNK